MTEEEKQQIRNKQRMNAERLERAFAPYFLGQTCGLTRSSGEDKECIGPACMFFQRQVEGDKIVGGNCSVNIIAQGVATMGSAAVAELVRGQGLEPGQMQRVIVPGQQQ